MRCQRRFPAIVLQQNRSLIPSFCEKSHCRYRSCFRHHYLLPEHHFRLPPRRTCFTEVMWVPLHLKRTMRIRPPLPTFARLRPPESNRPLTFPMRTIPSLLRRQPADTYPLSQAPARGALACSYCLWDCSHKSPTRFAQPSYRAIRNCVQPSVSYAILSVARSRGGAMKQHLRSLARS